MIAKLSLVLLLAAMGACAMAAERDAFEDSLAARIQKPVSLSSARLRLDIDPASGCWQLIDSRSGVRWLSSPRRACFARARIDGKDVELRGLEVASGDATKLVLAWYPATADKTRLLRLTFELIANGEGLDISFEPVGLAVERLRLLDEACWMRAPDAGYAVVPVREGLLVPADSGLKFKRGFDAYNYEGCHMAMCGFVRKGSALLVSWTNPYVALELESDLPPDGQQLLPSISLSHDARSLRLVPLGKGDHVVIGQAYRDIARQKGWLVTLDEKIKANPERAKLVGAINAKLWTALRRKIDVNGKEVSCDVDWTFDEVAQVAEHLKNDLKLDRVFFMLGGWVHRGYDNQHPDILPAAPECGGGAKLADCAKRVMDLGYIFCLHDNYQDIYRDSPSWNEDLIMKGPDGKIVKGGVWLGGQAYITCSKQALMLAKRPQNLTAVKKLTNANAYFIDTTYAAGLCECFDPKHPLKRQDDMKYKSDLSDYAREVFGMFGSECGREWAIPHSDFFEGLVGVSGNDYHDAGLTGSVGGAVVPLFEIVYRDCEAMWGKYGYDARGAGRFVAHHAAMGRPLYYHSIGQHLYWKRADDRLAVEPSLAELKPVGPGKFAVTYRWKVDAATKDDWRIFVHFTDAGGEIKFQNDHLAVPPTSQWAAGTTITDGPYDVTVPAGTTGTFDIRVGFYKTTDSPRAALRGRNDGTNRFIVGSIKVDAAGVSFEPPARMTVEPDAACYCRNDSGWAEGLNTTDTFMKNTYEILSPLHELTGRMQVTRHEFLTPRRDVSRTVFGGDAEAVANLGTNPFTYRFSDGLEAVLPAYGVAIRSPQFVAFHAVKWDGVEYSGGALFTLRSLDGKPIADSSKVRVYHGFGDSKVRVRGKLVEVKRETVVE